MRPLLCSGDLSFLCSGTLGGVVALLPPPTSTSKCVPLLEDLCDPLSVEELAEDGLLSSRTLSGVGVICQKFWGDGVLD